MARKGRNGCNEWARSNKHLLPFQEGPYPEKSQGAFTLQSVSMWNLVSNGLLNQDGQRCFQPCLCFGIGQLLINGARVKTHLSLTHSIVTP